MIKINILHIMLGNFYIDNYKYQENMIPLIHKEHGHNVEIIASTLVYKDNLKLSHIEPKVYKNEYSIKVTRIPYFKIFNQFITDKIRYGKGLKQLLIEKKPDIIFVHGFQTHSLNTICKYKKSNSSVKIYVDTHADYYTSGTNYFSRKILHGIYYKYLIKRNLPYIEKVFYISITCGDFLKNIYKIEENKMDFLPLGSILHKKEEIIVNYEKIRQKHGITKDKIVLLQAGKFEKKKNLIESLNEFIKIKSDRYVYIVIGSISSDIKNDFEKLCGMDNRILYFGWMNGTELSKYIEACDIFIQPGKGSVILQDAIAAYKPVIINYLKDYVPFVTNNGWLINDISELNEILLEVLIDDTILIKMGEESKRIAEGMLDYNVIASRVYQCLIK